MDQPGEEDRRDPHADQVPNPDPKSHDADLVDLGRSGRTNDISSMSSSVSSRDVDERDAIAGRAGDQVDRAPTSQRGDQKMGISRMASGVSRAWSAT